MRSPIARPRVAVIGLGCTGLATVKNLLEIGFDVTGYEKNEHVGGLWYWTPDKGQTTVLKSTVANGSKQFSAYQDFPMPDEYPDYPTAAQIADYLASYARHFELYQHLRLGVRIINISPTPSSAPSHPVVAGLTPPPGERPARWSIKLADREGERTEVFDRVVVATGPHSNPWSPQIPHRETFKGEVIHSQAYKQPEEFRGKKVVVVGIANTAADIAVELCGVAQAVFISHRSGSRIMTRQNPPIDHKITRRRFLLAARINNALPRWVTNTLTSLVLDSQMKKQFPGIKDEWRLLPAPPVANAPGCMNDHIMSKFSSGQVGNLGRILCFTKTGVMTKEEGEVDCDAVIFATGMRFDYSILSPEADPTAFPTPEWDQHLNSQGVEYPRLYRTLLHPSYPDSLAFIGPCRGVTFAAFTNSDLSSQAIAQLWAGAYPLPSGIEIETWLERNYRFSLNQIKPHRIPKVGSRPEEFEKWLNEVCGNGVNAKLGWGWEGWAFWWADRRLYRMLVDGINTPFVYRLWEGREGSRPVFKGAKEAIYKANGVVPAP